MIFWICPKLAGKHQDRVIVRATELRTFCRTALPRRVRDQRSAPEWVTDLLRRTVPIGSTTVKTIERSSEVIGKTTAKAIGTTSRTIALVASTILDSGKRIAWTDAMKFANR
jgi:hypothetical protein